MLIELSVRDLALIEAVCVELGPGLNVVTGETGAGKSLFVGALEMLLGLAPRGGAAQWVRRGAEEARVEGRVSVEDPALCERVEAVLRQECPEIHAAWSAERNHQENSAGIELVLGRTLSREGRTRAHVDQRPVPLRVLRAIAPLLLEIHGQNEHQRLLLPAEQRRLVDEFGGLGPQLTAYRSLRETWRELVSKQQRSEQAAAERRDRLDLLRYQASELSEAQLRPGERDGLVEERGLLRSAGDLARDLGGLVDILTGEERALLDRLKAGEHTLVRWADLTPRLAGALEDLRAAQVHVEEVSASLHSVLDGIEDDPARLEAAEERLSELERLEAKYRCGADDLPALAADFEREIEELEAEEHDAGRIGEDLAQARATLAAAAERLAQRRQALAPRLSKAVETTLKSLGLPQAKLTVAFAARAGDDEQRFGPSGDHDLELLLAANPGEEPGPLSRIASGGEAARIMLALATVLGRAEAGRTLVFDEIDAGVGGRLGPEVGAHLLGLSERHQVLCVTHLPAIAAAATRHFLVAKETKARRTRTAFRLLDANQRVGEVAAMIAGDGEAKTARAEARRLLRGSPKADASSRTGA